MAREKTFNKPEKKQIYVQIPKLGVRVWDEIPAIQIQTTWEGAVNLARIISKRKGGATVRLTSEPINQIYCGKERCGWLNGSYISVN